MSDNKEIAGPILAFVGGLIILIYGAVEVYLAEVASSIATLNGLPVLDVGDVVIAGVLGIVFGLLIMAFSVVAASNPDFGVGFGILIIVFSILSLLSVGGGNGVGLLLGVLGGTFCIVFAADDNPWSASTVRTLSKAPSTSASPSPPAPVADASGRTHHACPRCGAISPITSEVCPSCLQEFLRDTE